MNKRNFLITAALSAAFCFFGTANAAETLKIGASPVPHADILKVVQPELAKTSTSSVFLLPTQR